MAQIDILEESERCHRRDRYLISMSEIYNLPLDRVFLLYEMAGPENYCNLLRLLEDEARA